jgi:hypothetical protein
MDETFGVEALLPWGLDWQRLLEAGPGSGFDIPVPVLKQYLAKVALLKQRDARAIKRRGGRPRGTGMGGQAAALIACGVHEEDAVRIIAEHHSKPADKVCDALRRHRTGDWTGGTAMAEALDLDLLLAWGRDWQRYLEAGPGSGFHIPVPVLKQYVTKANAGLALLQQRDARAIKRGGGRPKGTGMGDSAAALIARGMDEEGAVRIIARHHGKTVDKVRDALRRHRAGQS